jgi:hypothetical protein
VTKVTATRIAAFEQPFFLKFFLRSYNQPIKKAHSNVAMYNDAYRLVLESNHPFLFLKIVSGNSGINYQRMLNLTVFWGHPHMMGLKSKFSP